MAFGITRCDAGPRMSRVQVATGSCLFDVRAASHTAQVALGKEDSSQGHHRAHHPLPGQLGKRRRFVAMGESLRVDACPSSRGCSGECTLTREAPLLEVALEKTRSVMILMFVSGFRQVS